MTAPDHEEDEEIEDLEVDERMDPGVRTPPQRPDDDETPEEIPYGEKPDIVDRDET